MKSHQLNRSLDVLVFNLGIYTLSSESEIGMMIVSTYGCIIYRAKLPTLDRRVLLCLKTVFVAFECACVCVCIQA